MKATKFAEEAIGIAFGLITLSTVVRLISTWELIVTATGGFFFFLAIRNSSFLVPEFKALQNLDNADPNSPSQQDVYLNRVASILFNLSTGVPMYLCYYGLLPAGWEIDSPITVTFRIPIGCAWSVGYVLYDFLYLQSSNTVMRLHHLGEMFIFFVYVFNPAVGTHYLLGGALMQLSSCFLHLSKILYVLKSSGAEEDVNSVSVRSLTALTQVLLPITWLHSRLWAFPLFMFYAWRDTAFTALHASAFVVGACLTIANSVWLYKIVRKTIH